MKDERKDEKKDEKDAVVEKSMVVSIAGDQIKVHSEEGAEHISRMANYINYIAEEFNAKKGYGVSRSMLLTYAALELCDTLFRERSSRTTSEERKYEMMFHREVFAHKKTNDRLELIEKKLKETEAELKQAKKDIDDLCAEIDAAESDGQGDKQSQNVANTEAVGGVNARSF